MGKSKELATLTDVGGTIGGALTVDGGYTDLETQDVNTYARITTLNGSAQLGLYRSGSAEGGFYIGGDADKFRVYDSSFAPRMEVDASGRVTMPYQPSFRASKSGSGVTIADISNPAVFDTALHNVGNHYNTSTGRFTAPVSGIYLFTCSIFKYTTYNNPTNTYWGFAKNGAMVLSTNHGQSGYDGGQCISLIIELSVNDIIAVNVSSGGPLSSFGGNFNSFTGHLIG